MKHTNTFKKQRKRQKKLVKSIERVEKSSIVRNMPQKPNPDTYKYLEDGKYNKKIAEIRKTQERIYNNVIMTSVFLNIFSQNPDDIYFLIDNKVLKYYQFDIAWKNPELVWKSIDMMAYDMAFGEKYFTVVRNGIFTTLHFTTKKKAMHIDEIIRYFSKLYEKS